jgi:hypothetical protein
MDKSKFQYEGLKWLYEMQLLDNPQLINNLKMNILLISTSIRDVELLIYREKKQMLVYVDLTWFGRKFKKDTIFIEVEEILSQLLPSFKFRITDDFSILVLAIERVKQALTRRKNETNTNADGSSDSPNRNGTEATSTDAAKINAVVTEDSKTDSQE